MERSRQLEEVTIFGYEVNAYGFCPYSLYADLFFPEKCKETPLLELLRIQGFLLEKEVLERKVVERHPEYTMEEISEIIRIAETRTPQETIQAMKEGREFIIGPMEAWFPLEEYLIHLTGRSDFLVKRKMRKESQFGRYCYDILEVKKHKWSEKRDVLQARFYALILKELQDVEPRVFVETSAKRYEIKPEPARQPVIDWVPPLTYVLEEIVKIKHRKIPWAFYERAKCRICGYHDFCRQRLKKDVSLVPGIGETSAGQLNKLGIFTIPELARCKVGSVRVKLRGYPYGEGQISYWQKQALAMDTRRSIIDGVIRLPKKTAFWDIETMGLDSTICPIIMIDVYDGKQHNQFVAEKLRDERRILEEFNEYVAENPNYFISYSRTRFDYRFLDVRYRKHKIVEFLENFPPERELDLAPEIKRICFLPVENYALGSVGEFFWA